MSETNSTTESWDGLLKNYLKADDLPGKIGADNDIVCVGVEISKDNSLELNVEYDQKKYIFSLNVTNMAFVKKNGIEAPKELIGKVLTVSKSVATNPQTKKEVSVLRISNVA